MPAVWTGVVLTRGLNAQGFGVHCSSIEVCRDEEGILATLLPDFYKKDCFLGLRGLGAVEVKTGSEGFEDSSG